MKEFNMLYKLNKWLDSLPDNVWIALLMGMSLLVSYVFLGGLE